MVWQDFVFFIGQWVFLVALWPTLKAREKPHIYTSVITSLILAVVQKFKIDKKNKRKK